MVIKFIIEQESQNQRNKQIYDKILKITQLNETLDDN